MEDITLTEKIYTHGGSEHGFFLGTPGVRCYYRLLLSENRRELLSIDYRNYCRLSLVNYLSRLSFL